MLIVSAVKIEVVRPAISGAKKRQRSFTSFSRFQVGSIRLPQQMARYLNKFWCMSAIFQWSLVIERIFVPKAVNSRPSRGTHLKANPAPCACSSWQYAHLVDYFVLAADVPIDLPAHSFVCSLVDAFDLGRSAASCVELAAHGRSAPHRFRADTPALSHRSRERQISFKIRIVVIFFSGHRIDSKNM